MAARGRREADGSRDDGPLRGRSEGGGLKLTSRWFFRAVLGYAVAAIVVFFGAVWRAEAVFDSKQATGDLAAFTFWNAVAGRTILSAVVVWVLGLLVAAYTELRGPHHAEGRRQIRFALGVPLAVFIAGIAVTVLLWW